MNYFISVFEKENGESFDIVRDETGFIYTYEELEDLKKAIENSKKLKTDYIKELNDERYDYYNGGRRRSEKLIKKKNKIGFVYVLKKTDENVFKIGMSKKFDERKKQISTKLPFEVETFKLFKTDDMEELEKHFHKKFDEKRMNGEWFNLNETDINYIKNYSLEVI